MIGILEMKEGPVFFVAAVGATTAAFVLCRASIATIRTFVATTAGFALQEASKVFEFLEFGIWEILSV